MNNFYFSSHQRLNSILKFCCSAFIIFISLMQVSAQDTSSAFTQINWSKVSSQKYGLSEGQGKVVGGKFYTFGGFDITKRTFTPTKRAYVYDPQTNVWSPIADLPYTPFGKNFGGVTHAGITTDSTDIYLAGGFTSNQAGTSQIFGTNQVWKYIVSQNAYIRLPDLPVSIAAGQLQYLDGKLHYMGGINAARTVSFDEHYVLDLNNLSGGWTNLASLPAPRQHMGSAVYGGKIYIIGGQIGNDATSVAQKDVYSYDPTTNTWTKLADLPVPPNAKGRSHIYSSIAVLGDRILVVAGEIVWKINTDIVSAYSPATNSWTNLTPLPVKSSGGMVGVINDIIYYTTGNKSSVTFKGIPVANTDTLTPLADAFVRDGSYDSLNFGNDTALVVKGSAVSNYTRLSYLKFSFKNINNIGSVKLRIYGYNIDSTAAINLSSYGVDDDTWTESGINFNNAPAASTLALSSVSINNKAKFYDFDVSSYVKTQLLNDTTVSFLIKDSANQNANVVFNSKESIKNKPKLIITLSANRSIATSDNKIQFVTKSETSRNLKKPVLYPNPTRKSFNIKVPASYQGEFSIAIADQQGRVYNIGNITLQPRNSTINVDISRFSLSAGVYFLKLQSNTIDDEMKLIIQ